ncbi:MAG: carbon-nitrogen hydrolase family protein [Zoogloeaceae bacterium]|jgi:nitrilase|nr:carbon-nitrogen hydrolase family protein [Zoogloeaceae bacterium]
MTAAHGTARIAAVQMVSGPDIAQNLREAERQVAVAAARGARMVALPEYFPLISGDEQEKVRVAERDGAGPLQDFLRETAMRHQVWLIGGSIPLAAESPGKVRNTCLVFDDAGRRVARYDKMHLFRFTQGTERYDERQTIEPGDRVVTFDSPLGRVGVSICYDLRFPELYRAMGPVDLLVVAAAFTHTTGQAHWELLLRARAVENLCYALASAQGGTHPSGRMTWGDSMIVDPWGAVLDRLPTGPGVVMADMDAARLAGLRASLPALQHRIL